MEINYNEEDLTDHEGIVVVIKDKSGNILVQDHVKFGFLTLPVGKVLPNQTVEEGLKREIFEECNLIVDEYKEIDEREYAYERKGKTVKVNMHLIEVLKYSGQIQNKEPEKHRKQEFVDLEEIKKAPFLSDSTMFYLENLGFKREKRI